MSSPNVDIHVIAERVAEVVNKKIATLDHRITEMESRLRKLELDVHTIRSQTIEAIVRSILGVKVEELATAIAIRVSTSFSNSLKDVIRVAEDLRSTVSEFRKLTEELSELKELPNKIAEAIASTKPEVKVDLSRIEASVNTALSEHMKSIEELATRVAALEKQVNKLALSLGRIGETLTSLSSTISRLEGVAKNIEEMKESVDYSREVLSILEEKLRRSSSEEEEE